MKKLSILIFTTLVISLTSCSNRYGKLIELVAIEKKIIDEEILTFYDSTYGLVEIKLKAKDVGYNVKLSYVMETFDIISPNSSSNIYLSLLDKDDFEITNSLMGAVVKDFKGIIKGQMFISHEEHSRIANAEIVRKTDKT